ncbi:MAG TPA: hypothetical protein VFS10_19855 [Pyrinomonadaceae bacterium]|nr:hypothetical protein [Pyrinomonadaceae bacterium]
MPVQIEGIYRDVLRGPAGELIRDAGWKPNLIVLRCRELLAAFMKGDGAEAPLGIQSLKIGRGDPAWDNVPPPPKPPETSIQLVDGTPFVIPKEDLTLQYLNGNNEFSAVPTNRLEIIAVLGPGQPDPQLGLPSPYPIREFGLFGKLKGVDYMIDYVRHPLIEKDVAVTLERRIHLIF